MHYNCLRTGWKGSDETGQALRSIDQRGESTRDEHARCDKVLDSYDKASSWCGTSSRPVLEVAELHIGTARTRILSQQAMLSPNTLVEVRHVNRCPRIYMHEGGMTECMYTKSLMHDLWKMKASNPSGAVGESIYQLQKSSHE